MEQYLTAQHLLLILERITFSIIAGAAIGLEREIARKQAGLRTMILICLGSTLYMTVSRLAALTAEQPFDVTRVAAQVVTGVGFIGAGAIIQARGHVHGLTTAATIWTVAAIGLIIGAGYPFLGLGVTAIVLFILVLIRKAEDIIVKRWVRVNDTVEDAESNEPLIR
ncbi:MAG TPA: MgtC/SapB family protein [Bacteroidetes bacterium]|nr:MgtC/SapB family protein [Bacteroidota bacterium]